MTSLQTMPRQATEPVIQELMDSASSDEECALGFAAAIHCGFDNALLLLAGNLDSMRFNPKIPDVVFAIHNGYKPHGPESIEALRGLVALRSDVPGLDLAVAQALRRAPDKRNLPTLALILASPDPEAQRSASLAFHQFTALARSDGSIGSGRHPYWTQDSLRFSGADEKIPVGEVSAYWSLWWEQHRSLLGLPE